ncbi:MAG: methyltransferase domain-containing protein [Solirubrobacterales bacterium]
MGLRDKIGPTVNDPKGLKERVKPAARQVIRRLPGRRVRWGTLRRTKPFSDHFGWDRGVPVDRFYIEGFLERNKQYIRGDALEVRGPGYVKKYGGDGVTKVHVVDIDPANPQATHVADLGVEGSVPSAAYDSIVFTQTLHCIPDDEAAMRNLWNSLRPGGTMLVTVPSTIRIDNELPDSDYWRYTPMGLEWLIRKVAGPDAVIHAEGHGNALTAIAFLAGIAQEELSAREIAVEDSNFPIVACARVMKSS